MTTARVLASIAVLVLAGAAAGAQPPPALETGRVPATALPAAPAPFGATEPGFEYQMMPISRYAGTRLFRVRFPAANMADHVQGIYYRPDGPGPFPGVVVMHGLLKFRPSFADFIAQRLAVRGIAALMLEMPGYGSRQSIANGQKQWAWLISPQTAQHFFRQAMRDVRRGVTWLQHRDEVDADRLGIAGVSLGGILGSLAMSIDPRVKRGVFFLAGGGLEKPLFESAELTWVRQQYAKLGLDRNAVRDRLSVYEPTNHAHRLRGRPVLLINAAFDSLITPKMTDALWRAAGEPPIVWVPGGHYTGLLWLPWVAKHAADHLTNGPIDQLRSIARSFAHGGRVLYPGPGGRNDERARTLDCVGFLHAALRRTDELRALDPDARKRLLRHAAIVLDHGTDLAALVTASAPSIRGAPRALIDAGLAVAVNWRNGDAIRRGDVIQVWKPGSKGIWRGHCSLVERVEATEPLTLTLYGSHKSKGGVGEITVRFDATADRVFIARPRSGGAATRPTRRPTPPPRPAPGR